MPARGRTQNHNPIPIDAVLRRIVVNPGEGARHVFDLPRMPHPGREPVIDRSQAHPHSSQSVDQGRGIGLVSRPPSSAVHVEHQRNILPSRRQVKVERIQLRIRTGRVVIPQILHNLDVRLRRALLWPHGAIGRTERARQYGLQEAFHSRPQDIIGALELLIDPGSFRRMRPPGLSPQAPPEGDAAEKANKNR